jgi:hypothetical protein
MKEKQDGNKTKKGHKRYQIEDGLRLIFYSNQQLAGHQSL